MIASDKTAVPADIFRAYDIRGIAGQTLTPEIVRLIAQSLGKLALSQDQKTMIIGRDGRLSGPILSEALKAGLLDSGIDVIDIGAVPTPVLYFATHLLDTQSGVMLTGSHNPVNHNGLKMVIAGETLSEHKIQALYQDILLNNNTQKNKSLSIKGHYQQKDITQDYIQHITNHIQLSRPLKIVIDAGNGIAGNIAPLLYRALDCEVIALHCDIDGNFPHHHPDPSVPENLQTLIQAVKANKADIGLAFDGDGDRLGVVTDQGEIIWPDRQMMLYAQDVLSRCPGKKIIFDVKCTRHLARIITKYNGIPEMYKTGHSLIKQKLKQENAPLAGEMSGHIFFKERWYGFDDGLYTGARLLEILSKQSNSASQVFQTFPDSINTPELKLAVTPLQRNYILKKLPLSKVFAHANIIRLDGLRIEFDNGWGLIRASNTTGHLILRFEAENKADLIQIQNYFKKELLALDATLELPF